MNTSDSLPVTLSGAGFFGDKIPRSFHILLPALVSALSLWYFYSPPGITADGHTYLQISRNFQYGIGPGWQALWAAPLPSLMTAVVDRVLGINDLLHTAGLISAFMAMVLTLSVYLLTDGIFGRSAALAASLVTAVAPHILWISRSIEPEIHYTAFLVSALALLHRALSRRSQLFAAAAGAAFCCAYMSRSEGFLIMVITVFAIVCVHAGQLAASRAAPITAVMIVTFFVTASPYLMFLKQNYGKFVISPKATYVLIWMKGKIYGDNNKGEINNDDLWGLTPSGKLKWQSPSGIGDLAAYLASDPAKSVRVYLRNLMGELPGRVPNNSGALHYPNLFPVYMALLATFALFSRRSGVPLRDRTLVAAPFGILFILPVFTEGWWKYIVPYAPLLIILAATGFVSIAGIALEKLFPGKEHAKNIVVAACVTALMSYNLAVFAGFGAGVNRTDPGRAARLGYADEARKAGQWAARNFGQGRNYMVAWNKMIYYLDGFWTAEPVAGPLETYRYAVANRVDLLVRECGEPEISDQELAASAPGFVLQTIYYSDTSPYRVAFYRPQYQ